MFVGLILLLLFKDNKDKCRVLHLGKNSLMSQYRLGLMLESSIGQMLVSICKITCNKTCNWVLFSRKQSFTFFITKKMSVWSWVCHFPCFSFDRRNTNEALNFEVFHLLMVFQQLMPVLIQLDFWTFKQHVLYWQHDCDLFLRKQNKG